MNKTFLCFSCRFSDMQIKECFVPLYAGSLDVKKVKKMVFWCKQKRRYMQKFSTKTKCGYRPKAGRISKKLYQMDLIECQKI